MSGSHNIVGSEATYDAPHRRLVHFSHVHGSIQMLRPRRGPIAGLTVAFLTGAVAVLALGLLILLRI